jgi:protein TonB
MSVSLFDKNWLDLVFDGKNQSYGAYRLRLEHTRTQCLAFIYGAGLLVGFLFLGIVISTPTHGETVKPVEPTILVCRLTTATEKEKTTTTAKKKTSNPKSQSNSHLNYIPVEQNQVKPEVETTSSASSSVNGTGSSSDGTNVDGSAGSTGGSGGTVFQMTPIVDEPDDEIINATMVDEMPEFPGGMQRFYDAILKNIDTPEIDQDIRLFVTFIIEPDGQMSHIQVLRDPGYGLKAETLRVMEKVKTPWKPGMQRGKKVRTQFTLPFTFKSTD